MFTIFESEQCILGGILINPDCLKVIRAELEPDDFSTQQNQLLYQAFLDVVDRGEPLMPVSVADNLKEKNVEIVDGEYIADLLTAVHTSAGFPYHIKKIKSEKLKSNLLAISNDIAEGVREHDAQALMDEVKDRLSKLNLPVAGKGVVSLSDALVDVVASLERAEDRGITTGLKPLDDLIGGWQPGDLIILAGRPGMGKSVLAKDFSEASKVPVLFFSLEMPRDQLIKRQLSYHSDVNYQSIRRSKIKSEDWDKIRNAANKLYRMPIAYNDNANMSIDELVATCEKQKDVGMVVIDYLQLIRSNGQIEHREREVALISMKLKGLARSLNIPVICLAQLNRSCETRGGDKKPMLSDLRESGAIEQDADTVIFIWREAVYKRTASAHDASLIVAKGRNTGTGVAHVYFDGNKQVFTDNPFAGYEA